jgi:two-component system sensor histidine kinase KdpD
MGEIGERPDPDALLRRIQEDDVRAQRGKLKVFFGFAPGVGKTYRMLQVARDLVIDQNLDVVIGIVETHRRSETAALCLGLEILPRRKVPYRGHVLEEFDPDAALARKPEILLVDELAHTNAPGSRHAKRWQDVLEILDAGINVFTTVNVQHVESLNDIIAQITKIQVKETIPDSILDSADEIELVDIAPEALLQRLHEGRVYLPETARHAAEHFFQRGNLLALRELALRRTAQHVDEDVREYRERHGVEATWPAGERILVGVGASPGTARVIRAGARMAAGLRCPWVAAFVGASALGGPGTADRERLESHLRLAETLGASIVRLSGVNVADVLLSYARKHNVTRILIGKPTHPRLRDRLRGSLLDEIVRGSGDIDVHVIRGDVDSTREPRGPAPRGGIAILPHVWSIAAVAATTVISLVFRALAPVPDIEVLYLLAVMLTAIRFGRGPSVTAAAASVAAYDFFFVEPFLTFAVEDARYVLTFLMMFGVGLVVGELTTRLRRQERDALAREQRTAALYALSRDLGTANDLGDIASVIVRHAGEAFDSQAFVLRPDEAGNLRVERSFPADAGLDAKEMGVARWCFEHGRVAGSGTETLPGSRTICIPLSLRSTPLGVLALAPTSDDPLRLEQRELLDTFARQAAFGLERARLSKEARASSLRAKAEEMRSSLLSAVSHDLRTPLAVITGSATSLRDGENLSDLPRAELLESICEEAERLERLVTNLLDMTRIESGGVNLKREWVPIDEVIGSALERLSGRLTGRAIDVKVAPDVPFVSIDPVVFEQLMLNLIENAAKYTPPGSPIDIRASHEDGSVVLDIMDRGPGLPPGSETTIFEKFHRGSHSGVSGAGLGLAICRGIAVAHGGAIRAERREGGGTTFRVVIPLVGSPPPVPASEAEDV